MSEPVPLANLLQEAKQRAENPRPRIVERLVRKFGWGECRQKRQALYEQLERLAQVERERVEAIISEAVCEAVNAKHPDRYFCVAVRAKLREARLNRTGQTDTW